MVTPEDDAQRTLDDHPGLDSDEATEEGRMMTGSGSVGPGASGEPAARRTHPTLENRPGLDSDEAMAEGRMMTAQGSVGKDVEGPNRLRRRGSR
jgi:hypothetical protein